MFLGRYEPVLLNHISLSNNVSLKRGWEWASSPNFCEANLRCLNTAPSLTMQFYRMSKIFSNSRSWILTVDIADVVVINSFFRPSQSRFVWDEKVKSLQMQGNTRIPSLKNLLQTWIVLRLLWAVPRPPSPTGWRIRLNPPLARRKATPSSDLFSYTATVRNRKLSLKKSQ